VLQPRSKSAQILPNLAHLVTLTEPLIGRLSNLIQDGSLIVYHRVTRCSSTRRICLPTQLARAAREETWELMG
jgi:hypothetical protein